MAWKPIVIDESFIANSESRIVHIPEGYYLMEGVEVEPSPETREEGYPYLLWQLRVVKGGMGFKGEPVLGAKLAWQCTMKSGERAQFNNGRIINLSGIVDAATPLVNSTLKTYKAFVGLTEALTRVFKGKRVTALVTDGDPWTSLKTGERYPTSKIAGLYPIDDYDNLAASMVEATPRKTTVERAEAAGVVSKDNSRRTPVKETPVAPEPVEDVPSDEDIDALFARVK